MNGEDGTDRSEEAGYVERWPVAFMLVVGAVALYLGWRLIQGIGALVGWMVG